MEIIDSAKPSGSMTSTVRTDVSYKRQNMNLIQTPPKSLGNRIWWQRSSLISTITASTSLNESNFVFLFNNLQGYSSLVAVFDQYCIYSVTLVFSILSVNNSTTNVSSNVILFTAIDYDNVANVGLNGIVQYETCEQSTLTLAGSSLIRYVKPCLDPITYQSNYGSSRLWVDSASPGALWYGLRCITQAMTAGSAVVQVEQIYTLGFRNAF
jgi:hypothetical protein